MIRLNGIVRREERRATMRNAAPPVLRDDSPNTGHSTESLALTALVRHRSLVSLPYQSSEGSNMSEQSEQSESISPSPVPIRFNNERTRSGSYQRIASPHQREDLRPYTELGLSGALLSAQKFQEFRDECARGACCPHQIRISRWSGVTTWRPDFVNTETARAAIETVCIQDLRVDESMARKISRIAPIVLVPSLRDLCGDRWFLDASQLALTRELGIIDRLPQMTDDEIDDLNKGDIVVTLLAVSQILWLCIQLITRLSRGIPTTQFEILTLAFAVCSLFTYGLSYSRPKDVHTVREVLAVRYPTPAELMQIAVVGPTCWKYFHHDPSIPNFATHKMDVPHFGNSIAVALVVFGSLHLAAWNLEFPTDLERRLWQASAVVTIVAFPTVVMIRRLSTKISKLVTGREDDKANYTSPSVVLIGFIAYLAFGAFLAARAFILVEIIRSLAYQSPEAFRTTWTANIPHVG